MSENPGERRSDRAARMVSRRSVSRIGIRLCKILRFGHPQQQEGWLTQRCGSGRQALHLGAPDGAATRNLADTFILHRRKAEHTDLERIAHVNGNVLAECVDRGDERLALNDSLLTGV